jgi:hypothetical protein
MALTFTWDISALETAKKEGSLTNVVKIVHWRYKATDEDGYSTETFGAQSLDTPNQDAFVSYEELTFDLVTGWLEQILDIDSLQQMLQNNIDNQKNPPIVNMGIPWVTTTTTTEE